MNAMPRSTDLQRRRHVALKDVALEAGVDPSTVSRVLNRSANVAAATRDRVESAIERLGYRPNRTARFLATQRTMTIGVLLPELRNLMHGDFLQGAQLVAQEHGYSLMICDGQMDPAVQAAELDRFIELRVDGVIVTRSFTMSDQLAEVAAMGVPVEPAELLQPDSRSAWRKRRAGSLDAFDELLDLGHRRIAMFVRARPDAPRRSSEMRSRIWSAREAIRRRGLPPSTLAVVGVGQPDSYTDALRGLMSEPEPPTALVAGNDSAAAPLLIAVNHCELSIPGDVSFLMYGDSQWAMAYHPPLSVIRYDYEAEGRRLMLRVLRSLGAAVDEDGASLASLEPDVFVRRGSTAPPAR